MKILPRSAFGQTVFLIGLLLFINQIVSYASFAHYVFEPHQQQINQLLAKQVRVVFIDIEDDIHLTYSKNNICYYGTNKSGSFSFIGSFIALGVCFSNTFSFVGSRSVSPLLKTIMGRILYRESEEFVKSLDAIEAVDSLYYIILSWPD